MDFGVAGPVGGRMLGEVEEASLDEVLTTLRQDLSCLTTQPENPITTPKRTLTQPKLTSIAALDAMIVAHFRATHSSQVTLTGRALPLLYALVSRLIASPSPTTTTAPTHPHNASGGKTVLVVDLEARFDPTRLTCPPSDLLHVYVHRPPRCAGPEEVRQVIASAQRWMLYGRHASRDREWWGTLVVGGPGGDIGAGWKGWARVDLDESGMGLGELQRSISAEEALDIRARGGSRGTPSWVVTSDWGGFRFKEGDLASGD